MWLIVLRTIGWVYAAMFRPLMRTTAWVYAILWVMFGPLNILNALIKFDLGVGATSAAIVAHVVQFVVGIYLMRYLWRSTWPPRQENARLGESDAQQPAG